MPWVKMPSNFISSLIQNALEVSLLIYAIIEITVIRAILNTYKVHTDLMIALKHCRHA